ncbi:MAG TPA: plastocyanin/azurin family copper-binding protein [Candidatus Limnocylindrales bacterium]
MPRRISVPSSVVLAAVVLALVVSAAAFGVAVAGGSRSSWPGGMMGGGNAGGGGGMMGGGGARGGYGTMMGGGGATTQPGTAGFVPGTTAAPRSVKIYAGPGYSFSPATITVARGETVTFVVLSMGGLVHDFMVGPVDAVASDLAGTPEIADIGMMQTKSLTYTFDGSGTYAYACHAAGHYEAGMHGTITLVG